MGIIQVSKKAYPANYDGLWMDIPEPTPDINNPKYRRTIQEESIIRSKLRIGDRVGFKVNKPWDTKGSYKSITDYIKTLYKNFAYTEKGYCVKYRDIIM